jgi:CDP-diacylglycerol--serine O-phosphatidyltransferase
VTAPVGRRGVRRAIVVVPGAFTSGNLFFGIWSIVEAARGEFDRAAWFIVLAAVMDGLDGRVARMTRTGSNFGAELDSLVDVISFGVAPAMLQWHFQLSRGEWGWLLPFIFILAVAVRLARFNIEQAGHAKSQFFGLPSPAGGTTIATLVPFMGTAFFAEHLSHLPWHLLTAVLMVLVSLLMVSHVPYPVFPNVGVRTWRARLGLGFTLVCLWAALTFPAYFFFPMAIAFIAFGLLRAVIYGYLDRLPDRGPIHDEFARGDVVEERPLRGRTSRNPLRPRHHSVGHREDR